MFYRGGLHRMDDMVVNPYQVTAEFEKALCEYTGAPYAVAVNSCTAALLLTVEWCAPDMYLEIPRRTYVSVPAAIKRAGAHVEWRDERWRGAYQLSPTNIWDCARRFTSGMYVAGQYQCVSFSSSKILGIEQGGAILHDNAEADAWFRRMRFDGRTAGVDPMQDEIKEIGHHCIILPSTAAALLLKLYHLPRHNDDLPEREYPDLSKMSAFK